MFRYKSLLVIIWSVFSLNFVVGCQENSNSFVGVESERTKLIDGIESYQSPKVLETTLKGNSLSWEVIEDSKKGQHDKRPPFDIYVISIKGYSHLGHVGELRIQFFNGRLMETWFYPLKADDYVSRLMREEDLKFNEKNEAELPPYTRLWISQDYKSRKYIGWEDIRLRREFNAWIRSYS